MVASSGGAFLRLIWRSLTEPGASIVDPNARQQARATASALVLTMALVIIPLLESVSKGSVPPYLLGTLVITSVAYAFSHTHYYRLGAIIAIVALWLLPTYAIVTSYVESTIFMLSTGRLLLLSLLLAYILS